MKTGFNLIGFPSSSFGLAAAARNTLELLLARGNPISVMDLATGSSGQDRRFAHLCVDPALRPAHPVNLFHLNPPDIANLMGTKAVAVDWDRFNVCVPFWELPRLPREWIPVLERMDMVLAPSRFLEGILSTQLGKGKIRYYKQFLKLPEPSGWDRGMLGIPRDHILFGSGFDFSSDIHRKNPMAVLEVFHRNFRDHAKVHLAMKLNNQGFDAQSARQAEAIRQACKAYGNIHFLEGDMPHAEVLAFYRDCDVYVSLHRSEGLGLGPMECMQLGRPVLATGWSGNMDFMSDSNSCLVGYRLVPVPKDSRYGRLMQGEETVWADPDLEEAGYWMRRLAAEPDLRRTLGSRAASDIREFNRDSSQGKVFEDLDHLLDSKGESGRIKPTQAGLRMLWQNRNDSDSLPGGDTTVIRETIKHLREQGERVDTSWEDAPDLDAYRLVHLNNISRSRDTLEQARNAVRRDRRTVLTPLYEDMDRYLVPATKLDLLYQRLAASGTRVSLEEIRLILSRFELPGHPLDNHVAKYLGIGDKDKQREILARVDCVVTSGEEESRSITEAFGPMRHMESVHFGFNREFLQADGKAFADKYGLKDFVLCVGRLESRKNQWSLIEIFRTLPHLKLVLIGAFSNPGFTAAAKAYAPANVVFLERLPFAELVSAFGAARVHALPSWYELPGLVSLEAAAAGCRIVTTSWGTARDYFGDRVHYCEPDDQAGIRAALLAAYDTDPGDLRAFVGETYGWDKTARKLREIYGRVVSRPA